MRGRWRWPLAAAGVVGLVAALRLVPVNAPTLPPAVQPILRVLSAIPRESVPTAAIPYLGVNYLTASRADPAAAQMGLLVASVDGGSPAEAAGIRPGDLLIAINGVPLHRADSLVEPLRSIAPGDTVTLGLQRGADIWDVDVRLSTAGR